MIIGVNDKRQIVGVEDSLDAEERLCNMIADSIEPRLVPNVENPGILLPGMTIEDMKQGVSRIRNPVIARVFRELGLIEQWGEWSQTHFQGSRRIGPAGTGKSLNLA